MGIVIINGKKYDSVTGLLITDGVTDDFAEVSAYQGSSQNQKPDWLNSFISNDNKQNQDNDHQTTSQEAITPVQSAKKHNLKPVGQQSKIEIQELSGDQTDQIDTNQKHQLNRTAGKVIRRTAVASRTLNRRFVKKPIASGGYAESIAVQHVKQVRFARELAKPIQIADEAGLAAASQANNDFIPALTKIQITNLENTTQDEPLREKINRAKKDLSESKASWVDTTKAQPSQLTSSVDDILDDRLEKLSQILQNVHDIDKEQQVKPKIKSRADSSSRTDKANKRRLAKQRRQELKAERKARRRFRMPTIYATAGAMAIVIGLTIYMAMPTISIKLAASKAGIDAKSPYVPAGFSIKGDIAHTNGSITINYKKQSGGDGYSLTQTSRPNMTDQQLRNEISASNAGVYHEDRANGVLVYYYRDVITWIRNGMQYTVNSNDYLDNDQVNNIVKSL